MPWLDAAAPVRMERVALVAPTARLRDVLAQAADAGTLELDSPPGGSGRVEEGGSLPAGMDETLLRAVRDSRARPALAAAAPDLAELAREERYDLLAGEAEVAFRAAGARRRSAVAALAGWVPAAELPGLARRLAAAGGALAPMPHPAWALPPTLIGGPSTRRALTPLVRTYGVVPYADIDPSWLAWASYVVMFGMMFGDVGQGLILVAAAVALRAGWPAWARRWRAAWPFVGGAGVAATVFGFLYGEFFGPTGVVPTLWLNPLDEPVPLLLTAVAVGAVLLAGAYGLGTLNRWREGGWPLALYAPSGIAGTALFLGIAIATGGWYIGHAVLLGVGAGVAVAGLGLAFTGFLVEAGGRGAGVAQASVELFDLVIRLGSNVVSFARLAAFGLTHAALGLVVWDATRAAWHQGGAMVVAAVAVFIVGNALAFALEALVAAIQALRLEYYELFSRVFQTQGREFRPWHVPIAGAARAAGGDAAAGEPAASGEGAP